MVKADARSFDFSVHRRYRGEWMEYERPGAGQDRRAAALEEVVLRVGVGVGVLLLLSLAIVLSCSDYFINRYFKPHWLRSFAAAHPGHSLKLGRMSINGCAT